MTLDDLEKVFWGDQREQPTRVRLARVISGLSVHLDSQGKSMAAAELRAILATSQDAVIGASDQQGDVHGFRTGIGSPESREAGSPRGMEREGNVSLSGERLAVHGQPSAASGNLPGGDSDRLPPSHRHEDSGRPVRAVGGFTVGPDCRGLERGPGVSRDEAAGGGSGKQSTQMLPTPAADVCTWSHPKPGPIGQLVEYERSTCGNPKWAEGYPKWVDGYFENKCQCGRPIYVDLQDPANAWLMESRA
jgi:hypothetical protein